MARRIARDPIYSGRRFSADTIETCVRWYITYRLSYRDLVAMMAEQGIAEPERARRKVAERAGIDNRRLWPSISPGSKWRPSSSGPRCDWTLLILAAST